MNKIKLTKTSLKVQITGIDKLWSFKGQIEVPVKKIKSITLYYGDERPPFWRAPGTCIPGIIIAGTYYGKGRKEFWNMRYRSDAIEIRLKDADYTKIVLDCDDAKDIISKFESLS